MLLTMMKSKLHRATVTQVDLNYEGSISIDLNLIEQVGFLINEKVDIYNINNGIRFSTYVIKALRGSREIGLNGAAARITMKDDKIIIVAYASMDEKLAKKYKPKVLLLNNNTVIF